MLRRALRWFFSQPGPDARGIEVYVWWEQRRIPYNIIVGLGAIVSFVLFLLFITMSGHLQPGEDAEEPLGLLMAAVLVRRSLTCATPPDGSWISWFVPCPGAEWESGCSCISRVPCSHCW